MKKEMTVVNKFLIMFYLLFLLLLLNNCSNVPETEDLNPAKLVGYSGPGSSGVTDLTAVPILPGIYDVNDTHSEITLDNLRNLNHSAAATSAGQGKDFSIRQTALREMALSVGMRGGLYWRSKEINQFFLANSNELDKIFDFSNLMLANNVIPPVLIEAIKTMDAKAHDPLPTDDDNFLLNDNPTGKSLAKTKVRAERAQNNFRTLRITDKVYKIIRQARFAVTIPTWRDYLQLSFTEPSMPESSVLPRTQEEQNAWAEGIEQGWNIGLQQADQILSQNLMLLKRDYLGMIRYKKLLAMNMVSAPFVAKRNYGVTGDGDEIKIHDQVLTIAALPALKPDSKLWTPYITQGQEEELEAKISKLNIDHTLKYLPSVNTGQAKNKIVVKDKSNQIINKKELYKK